MVFCGLYPIDSSDYNDLREALEKLELNDASLSYEPETSTALGFGFRCGFLGLLHMEIIQERIEREFNIPLITTAPSVVFRVTLTNGEMLEIDNPSHYPEQGKIEHVEEPYVKASIIVPERLCRCGHGAVPEQARRIHQYGISGHERVSRLLTRFRCRRSSMTSSTS